MNPISKINEDVSTLNFAVNEMKSMTKDQKLPSKFYVEKLKSFKTEIYRVATNLVDHWKNLNPQICLEIYKNLLNLLQEIRTENGKFSNQPFPNPTTKKLFHENVLDLWWLERQLTKFIHIGTLSIFLK